MYHICICDDDAALCASLTRTLYECAAEKNLDIDVSVLPLDTALLEQPQSYDILFLDIRFNGKDTGLNTARQLRANGNNAIIVFLTSYGDYATEGYEVEAFRFIVKPYTQEKVSGILDAVVLKRQSASATIAVKAGAGVEVVKLEQLITVESLSRKRYLHTTTGDVITWETLKEIYTALPHNQFAYPQKSFIVNMQHVVRVKNNVVIMKGGFEIPLGRNYKDDFMLCLNRYVGSKV